ncbi:MAG: DUF1579 domain-containing protein [Chryseolinea sp.]
MKNLKSILFVLVICTGPAFAQSEAEMKAWQAYMTPSDNHKTLAKDVGSWKTEMSSYMDPKAAAIKSVGTAETSMILGGRYQQTVYKGDMMGMAFEGISILGYDNTKKVFVNSWIDNMGTGMMVLEGEWDQPGKKVIYLGKCVDPMTGKDMKVRQVVTIENEKSQYMEMFMTQEGGKEEKTLELRMTKM